MFMITKMMALLLQPLPIFIGLLFIGLLSIWYFKGKWISSLFVATGTFGLLFSSISLTSGPLINHYEGQYPAAIDTNDISVANAKYIVVLGSGHSSNDKHPITSQLGNSALTRAAEGIRLYKILGNKKLILSGSGVFDKNSSAKMMKKLALDLGVLSEHIILEERPKTTYEEALFIKPLVGTSPFVLVTSASHMPRSISIFKNQGMNPLSAPTQHLFNSNTFPTTKLIPNSRALRKTERALYEFFSTIWNEIRNQ